MIRTEQDGPVTVITLSRPDKRNALTPEMFAALRSALGQIGSGRALVLAGDGPVFCGGFDLRLCLDKPGTLGTLLRELATVCSWLRAFPGPTVIAAHGAAIAGGCALLTAADFVVADENARIGYPVVPLGISPAVSAPTLRSVIGDGHCRERLLDPAVISGREAARMGLVHEIVARPEAVRPRALAAAHLFATKPLTAFRATKAWLSEIERLTDPRETCEQSLGASLSIVDRPEQQQRLAKLFSR